jgi:hypothetical protein
MRISFVDYYMTQSALGLMSSNCGTIGEWCIGNDLDGSTHCLIRLQSHHFPEGTWKVPEVRIFGLSTDIRVEHFPTVLERYLLAKMFGYAFSTSTDATQSNNIHRQTINQSSANGRSVTSTVPRWKCFFCHLFIYDLFNDPFGTRAVQRVEWLVNNGN